MDSVLPMFYRTHGLVATPSLVGFGGNFRIRGGKSTCPLCPPGAPLAETFDCDYTAAEGTYEIFTAGMSHEAILAVNALLSRVQRREISVEDAKREVEKIEPRARVLFDIWNWSDQAQATVLAAILLAAAGIGAAVINRSAPASNIFIENVTRKIVRSSQGSSQTPPKAKEPLQPHQKPKR
jgi:hypothetical protein